MNYEQGTFAKSKKKHPCGSDIWEILRVGADIKIKCTGCEHIVTLARSQFDKQFKPI